MSKFAESFSRNYLERMKKLEIYRIYYNWKERLMYFNLLESQYFFWRYLDLKEIE